jgi:hypothetical protein
MCALYCTHTIKVSRWSYNNHSIRRTLSKAQRLSYIAAVKCLREKPSLLDPVTFPGSKSLFDDFVAIHLMQTMNIHLSVRLTPGQSIPSPDALR